MYQKITKKLFVTKTKIFFFTAMFMMISAVNAQTISITSPQGNPIREHTAGNAITVSLSKTYTEAWDNFEVTFLVISGYPDSYNSSESPYIVNGSEIRKNGCPNNCMYPSTNQSSASRDFNPFTPAEWGYAIGRYVKIVVQDRWSKRWSESPRYVLIVPPPTLTTNKETNVTAYSAKLSGGGYSYASTYGIQYHVKGSSGAWTDAADGATITGLQPCTDYEFRSWAKYGPYIGSNGTMYGPTREFRTEKIQAPTGVSASRSGSSVNISWNSVQSCTGYNILWCGSLNGSYIKLNSTPLTTTSYTDKKPQCEHNYYKIEAISGVACYNESSPYDVDYDCYSTLVFNGNGGYIPPTSRLVIYGKPLGNLPPAPTRQGYTFKGWNLSSNCDKKYYSEPTIWDNYDPTVVWALWACWNANTYTVTYNGNGNTGGSTASSNCTYDDEKKLPRNGFTRAFTVTYNYGDNGQSNTSATATSLFTGWAKTPNGIEIYGDEEIVNLTTINNDKVNLYARWYDGSVTLPTPKAKTGYIFNGWYTAVKDGEKAGNAGENYTPTAAITLYAQWVPVSNITITYNYNGATGGNSEASKSVTYNSTYGTLPSPTKEYAVTYNYNGSGQSDSKDTYRAEFVNWYREPEFANVVRATQTVTTASNLNLYAKWNDGAVLILPTPNARTGYSFNGWYDAASGGKKIGNAGENYTPTAAVTLYAQWAINTGIENTNSQQQGISIFPNPAKDEIFIKSDLQIENVEILDFAGRTVETHGRASLQQNGTATINISALPQGVYLLKVYTGNAVMVSKIVKE